MANALREQRLIQLVPEYSIPQQGVYAVFPNTAHVPEKVRRFVDFMREFPARKVAQEKHSVIAA
ncbi:hypothetical protein [Paraburkholderia phenazinium]|uniref:hypothetical protein n=1 Tax=Paraburkholderia phenazinium TaxID=60549 RepID=UPI003CC66039